MDRVEISRRELYQAIWSRPLGKVAEEIDSTIEQLVLACTDFDIPRPPTGYWAKKLHQAPLPPQPRLEGNQEKIVRLKGGAKSRYEELERRAKELEQFKSFSEARVSSRLASPHPAVESIIAERRRGFRSPGGSGFIHALHSSPIEDVTKRIFRILDCLSKTLSDEGFTIEPGDMGAIHVIWRGVGTSIRFKERLRMPRDERGKIIRNGNLERTGILFSESYHRFEDKIDAPIEVQIPQILRSIAAECLRREKTAKEAEERAKLVEARRAELLAERAFSKKKNEAIEKLFRASEQWHQASRAREFLAVVETLPASDTLIMGLSSSQWIDLLRTKIADSDPLRDGLEGLIRRVTD